MADFKWDLTGCTPIERDMPVVADTYTLGEILCDGVTDGTDISLLKSGEGVYNYFAGILCDDGVTTTGTIAARTAEYVRVIVNPFGIYECPIYAPATSISLTAYTSGTPNLTFTCGSSKGHPNLGGGYLYSTAGAADVDNGASSIGQLVQIASSSVSTTTQTVVLTTAATLGFSTSTDVIVIYPAGRYMVDLTAVGIDGTDLDSGGGTAGTDGMAVRIIENYIQYDGLKKQVLKSSVGNKTGLSTKNPKFWSHVCFAPSASYLV